MKSPIRAEIVAGALRGSGIPADVWMGNFEGTAYGPMGSARVMVPREHAVAAREIIEEVENDIDD